MPRLTLAGHPLHPQLIGLPLGLLPFSMAMDVMYLITGRRSYSDAAFYSMAGGSLGAVAAGAAGAADYLTIPSGTNAKKAANVHAILNLSMMGLYGINLMLRQASPTRNGTVPMLLSAVGTVGLTISQWYGGYLVYEQGMRVKPVNPDDRSTELKLPGDDRIVESLEALEEIAPNVGPTL